MKVKSNVGNVYRSKRWAKRWARGRPIRKVPGGWMICRGRRKKRSRKKKRRRSRSNDFIL